METQDIIKVENLGKKFSRSLKRSMAYGTIDLFKSFIGFPINPSKIRKSEFWALEDINFDLKKGESLGIIGMNGSGKSTLLRLLTGIYPPDKGKIEVNGTISSLIAVGAGFHPHMTGRENIFLNGTILGMTSKQIDKKMNEIIEMADIGDFLDAPVSTYSSGMRVRLGFAIAVQSEPDILLVDEILSVGDITFKNKSLRYMSRLREKARAIIFVSHNMEQVRVLCDRVIVLNKGRVVFNGETDKGIVLFEELSRDVRLKNVEKEITKGGSLHTSHFDSTDIKVKDIGLINEKGERITEVELDSGLKVFCEFEVQQLIPSLSINIPIIRDDNLDVYCISVFSDDQKKFKFENLEPGTYKATLDIKDHHLNPGTYMLGTLTLRNDKTFETYNKARFDFAFKVKSNKEKIERGFINVDYSWKLEKQKWNNQLKNLKQQNLITIKII